MSGREITEKGGSQVDRQFFQGILLSKGKVDSSWRAGEGRENFFKDGENNSTLF